jgi:hypothetical protein
MCLHSPFHVLKHYLVLATSTSSPFSINPMPYILQINYIHLARILLPLQFSLLPLIYRFLIFFLSLSYGGSR